MAYLNGKATTLTFGAYTVPGSDSTCDQEIGEVDYTNFTSNGAFEGGTDVSKTTFNFTQMVNSSSLPTYVPGSTGTYTKAISGGHTVTGSATITRRSIRTGPRGAYTIQASGFLSGTVTNS